MIRFKPFIVSAALLMMPVAASAFTSDHPGCGGNCLDCHSLGKKEADEIVKKGNPKGTVLDVKMSPVKGLWQVDVEIEGKKGAVFIDFSKQYLLVVNQIARIDAGAKQPQKINFSSIPLKDALVLGSREAKKKVAVFTDPDCPFCRNLHNEIKQVLNRRSDVAFYLILRPLPIHKDAYKKAQAVLCGKSPAMLDDAFAGKAVPEPGCPNTQVEKNIALAQKLGFNSTPTLVRDDGAVLTGFLPADKLSEWIDRK